MFNSVWYKDMTQPMFAPPEWVFAPVWSVLYLLIFLAFALYFFKPAVDKKRGYVYFVIQMVLNLIWVPIFFGYKNVLFAFLVIVLLDFFVLFTMNKFYSVSKFAGLLFLPYFLWILFATYLNLGYLLLN